MDRIVDYPAREDAKIGERFELTVTAVDADGLGRQPYSIGAHRMDD